MQGSLRERYGDWALVTGASAGIGEAFARRLAREGFSLVLAARRASKLATLADELQSAFGVSVIVAAVDLARDGFLDEIARKTEGVEISLLVNNAGAAVTGRFFQNDATREAETVRLNCLAPVVLTRHFLPGMVQRRKGGIVIVSSTVSGQPTPYWATYAASKVFDLYFGEALATELRGTGVDSVVVLPGGTKTEFHAVADVREAPMSRAPEQVVETALRSLGHKSSAVDGFGNRARLAIARLLPRRLVTRIAGQIMSRRQ